MLIVFFLVDNLCSLCVVLCNCTVLSLPLVFGIILAKRVSDENCWCADGKDAFKIVICSLWNVWLYCVEYLRHISLRSHIVVTSKADNQGYIHVVVQ